LRRDFDFAALRVLIPDYRNRRSIAVVVEVGNARLGQNPYSLFRHCGKGLYPKPPDLRAAGTQNRAMAISTTQFKMEFV